MSNIVQSSFCEASIAVFLDWLSLEYAKYSENKERLPAKLLRNSSDMRQFAEQSRHDASEESPVKGERHRNTHVFPLFKSVIGSIDLDGSRSGYARSNNKRPVETGRDIQQGWSRQESMTPIRLSLGGTFESDSLADVLIFTNIVLNMAAGLTLTLTNQEIGSSVETTVYSDGSLTIPSAELGSPGDPFRFDTTFIISTYMGIETEIRLIKELVVNVKHASSPFGTEYKVDAVDLIKETVRYYERFDTGHPNFLHDYNKRKQSK